MWSSIEPRRVFIVLAAAVGAVSIACSQIGGARTADSFSPTAPSAVLVTAGAVSGAGGAAGVQGAPMSSYNASGTWRATIGPHHGDGSFESDVVLVQGSDGNIIGTPVDPDDSGVLSLRRLGGPGRVITYAATLSGPQSCLLMTGTARLDTETETLTANVQGTTDQCEQVTGTLTMRKVS
jgi:hypothetical protein